mmetsp:Transcript_4263/g.8342  ORF Transcript_4263/g.8342 Transcript_4263/m.8342 type:complete len:283 (-) Transcript_4263:1222-2070(-)
MKDGIILLSQWVDAKEAKIEELENTHRHCDSFFQLHDTAPDRSVERFEAELTQLEEMVVRLERWIEEERLNIRRRHQQAMNDCKLSSRENGSACSQQHEPVSTPTKYHQPAKKVSETNHCDREEARKSSRDQRPEPEADNNSDQKVEQDSVGHAPVGGPRRIRTIDVDELKAIPSYIRGRIDAKKLAQASEEIEQVLSRKYSLLARSTRTMDSRELDKFEKYVATDEGDMKHAIYFTDANLREETKIMKLTSTGKSVLNILRYAGVLKEVQQSRGTKIYVLV